MKILFTGASSFTGFWFVQELASKGHEVWATFTVCDPDAYEGVREERVKKLENSCKPVWDCKFGDDKFLSIIKQNGPWDFLCHHAADVTNYKSLDFDIGSALSANTKNTKQILEELLNHNCNNIALTGSAFEQNEGLGESPLRAFSPYGLSKGLTTEVFQFWCQQLDINMGKFVIPNPFGPYEEPRFTSYLANTWLRGDTAGVNTPLYVRDNIHISLLAISYVEFIEKLHNSNTSIKYNPSGYIESRRRDEFTTFFR